jgi:hypothetical protein
MKDADASLFAAPATEGQQEALPPTAEQASKGAVAIRTPKAAKVAAVRPSPAPQTADADLVAILQTYERLADKPNVTPDALGKLLDVQELWRARKAQLAFEEAFAQMQPNLPVVEKDGRIIVREKTSTGKRDGEEMQNTPYAKWETAWLALRPILGEYGFSLRHRIATVIDGTERRVRITAVLSGHGHTDDSCYFDLPADSTGSKNNNQAWASSVSYGKRHTGFAILGIVAKGEDDDAKASGKPVIVGEPMTPEHLERLIEFAGAVQCPEPHLVKHLNSTRPKNHPELAKLADLPMSRFDEAITALRSYESNRKAREADASKTPEKVA